MNAFSRQGLAGALMGRPPGNTAAPQGSAFPQRPATPAPQASAAPPGPSPMTPHDSGPSPASLPLNSSQPAAPSPPVPAGRSYGLGDPSSPGMIQRWAAILKQNGMNQADPQTGRSLMAGQMPDAAPPQSLPDRAPMNIVPPSAQPPSANVAPAMPPTGGPAPLNDQFAPVPLPAAPTPITPPMQQQAPTPFADPDDPNNPANRYRIAANAAGFGALPSPYG